MNLRTIKGISLVVRIKNFRSICGCPRSDIHSFKSSELLILSKYFKLGRVQDAEELFEEMPDKNVVAWSIMIHGYAKHGFPGRSTELFSCMRDFGLVPISYSIVGVLVGIARLGYLVLARSIHGLIVKNGLESDSIVGTAMLDAYAKSGNVLDSIKLFEQISNPSPVSCNAMLAGFNYNQLFEEMIALFNQFQKYGLVPNFMTVLTLIKGCIALGSRGLCESTHGFVVQSGLVLSTHVSNSLLGMYSTLMDLDSATKMFNEMESRDAISWTTMIGLLVHMENAFDALRLFSRMRYNGVEYDAVVFMNVILACTVLGDLNRGKQVHAQVVVRGFGLEIPLANSMIAMYSKCGELNSSETVFNHTEAKNPVSWTTMISGYVKNEQPRQALDLLIRIRAEETFGSDSVMVACALTVCGKLAALELCQQLHCYTFQAGFSQYGSVQNSLISAYSKCGNVESAHNVFKEMNHLRDTVSWNALITGCGINGHGKTAVALFHEMKKNGAQPDSATYLCVLSACSHSGFVDDGLIIFNQMVEVKEIVPSQEHYGCVIDLLARADKLSEASNFMGQSWKGMGLNGWRALLGGCMLHGNMELTEIVARMILEQDPEEPDLVVLLSNIYASAGRFQDAEAVRLNMEKKGLTKNSGFSLISGPPCIIG